MPITLRSGAKAMGLAALLTLSSQAWSADQGLTLSWAEGSSWTDNAGVEISLGAYVDAYAFYHDVDRQYSEDAVRRTFLTLNAALASPVTAASAQTYLTTAGNTYATSQRDFADGIEIEDAQIYLSGTAYNNVTFGITVDGGNSNSNVTIDDWYIGLKDIPGLGEFRIGAVDIDHGLGEGQFYDDSVVFNAFNNPEGVGFYAFNEFKEGRLGYIAAVAIESSVYGGKDKNYDLQGAVYGIPWQNDNGSFLLRLDAVVHNPSGTGHNAMSETWTTAGTLFKGPTLVSLDTVADEVRMFTLAGSFVYGRVMISGSYTMAESDAPALDTLAAPMVSLLTGATTASYNEYYDTESDGYSVAFAYSLTGEKQEHGGTGENGRRGITKPKADFAWDGSGYGAFEVVGRFAHLDVQDNAADAISIDLSNPMAMIVNQSINREEGGEVSEASVGVNWYPNSAVSFGLYFSSTSWELPDGTVTPNMGSVMPATGTALPASFSATSLGGLVNYVNQATIENNYDVQSFYFRSTVWF